MKLIPALSKPGPRPCLRSMGDAGIKPVDAWQASQTSS